MYIALTLHTIILVHSAYLANIMHLFFLPSSGCYKHCISTLDTSIHIALYLWNTGRLGADNITNIFPNILRAVLCTKLPLYAGSGERSDHIGSYVCFCRMMHCSMFFCGSQRNFLLYIMPCESHFGMLLHGQWEIKYFFAGIKEAMRVQSSVVALFSLLVERG